MVRKYRFYLRNKTVRYSSLVAFILIFFSSFDVYAHGLNVRYELPIPLSFYLFTSGIVVMITIFLVSYFRFYSYIKESKKITEYRYSNFKLKSESCSHVSPAPLTLSMFSFKEFSPPNSNTTLNPVAALNCSKNLLSATLYPPKIVFISG